MTVQNGGKQDRGDLTQDELNEIAAVTSKSVLADGIRLPEDPVERKRFQIEQEKKRMREFDEYKEYEKALVNDVGSGKQYVTKEDFFDALVDSLDEIGRKGSFEREATELFLTDNGVEYEEVPLPKPEPPMPEPSEPEPAPAPSSDPEPGKEPEPTGSEKIWQEWLAETKDWTLEKEKKFIQEHYPEGLAVRGDSVAWNEKEKKIITAQSSNFDGEACLFFFRKLIGLDEEYLNKTRYVMPSQYVPGALNLDTSWGVWGGAGRLDNRAEAYDHHALPYDPLYPPPKPEDALKAFKDLRKTSAFQMLYDLTFGFDKKDGKGRETYKNRTDKAMANPEEKIAWENLALFVTAVDSLTLPPGVSWEEVWDNFANNIFAICITHQGLTASRVEKLFEFFKTNSWEDAFKPLDEREITTVLGRAFLDKKTKEPVFFSALQADIKKQSEDFFNSGHNSTLFSPIYGRILVAFNEQVPGGTLAAFGHGYDAILLWKPEQNSFMLNVRPEKPPIPHARHEKLGKDQSVWVRGGMMLQPEWRSKAQGLKKLSFSFTELIKELGIDEKILSAGFKRKIDEAEKCWKK